jgi:6-phosphogluconolactonase
MARTSGKELESEQVEVKMKQISRRKLLEGAFVAGGGMAASSLMAGAGMRPAWSLAGLDEQAPSHGGASAVTLFVGTHTGTGSKGVYAYDWSSATGTATQKKLAAEIESPTYLALSPDKRYLFTANEVDLFHGVKSGGVSSFRVGPGAGQLTAINGVTSGGGGTCFVGVDPSGRTLLCANYTGGSAASFRIGPDGVLSQAVSEFHYTGHGPNPDRQEASHVHRAIASPSGKYAFFNDLGLDVIHIYKLDAATAKLTAHTPAVWQAPPGSGPRALRFHPNGRWAYCVLEMGASVVLLEWDEAAGTLTTRQEARLTPEGFTGRAQASEIVLDRSGRFAYAACRFYDTLVNFSVDPETGRLTILGRSTCGGKVPRDITLDPSERWMLVANQESDVIAIIARDHGTGLLADKAQTVPLAKPQCLVFS